MREDPPPRHRATEGVIVVGDPCTDGDRVDVSGGTRKVVESVGGPQGSRVPDVTCNSTGCGENFERGPRDDSECPDVSRDLLGVGFRGTLIL